VLLVAAGMLGVKPLFILAAMALLAGSVWVAFSLSARPGKSVAGVFAQH
jgi:hypothetical protein